jgi:riboflavin synthase
MFSGIVEELGTVRSLKRSASRMSVGIQARDTLADTRVGDSIAVNGYASPSFPWRSRGLFLMLSPRPSRGRTWDC